MNTVNARRAIGTFGAVLLGVAVACAPTLSYAQHSGGGGGGGGGHGGGGGGGHSSGGHFGGGHSGGGHFAGGRFGGAHYGGSHFGGGAYAAHGFQATHGSFAGGRGGFAGGRGGFAGGRGGWGGRYWGGGYWGGGYWPYAYYYPGYAAFLPFLPLGYATYWWGGVPYYYSNNLYYNWDADNNDYVVTDPPPVAGRDSGDASGDATGDAPQYNGADASQQYSAPQPPAGARGQSGSADVYVYPRNGQNDQQTSSDRYQCHSWAANQTGFDPTRSGQQAGNPADYRRAIIACLDARGYTAR